MAAAGVVVVVEVVVVVVVLRHSLEILARSQREKAQGKAQTAQEQSSLPAAPRLRMAQGMLPTTLGEPVEAEVQDSPVAPSNQTNIIIRGFLLPGYSLLPGSVFQSSLIPGDIVNRGWGFMFGFLIPATS